MGIFLGACQIWEAGLVLEGVSGEGVAFWRFTLLSRWSKVKFKLPCNFKESPYVDHISLPNVIYEHVDIMLIEIYRFHQVF